MWWHGALCTKLNREVHSHKKKPGSEQLHANQAAGGGRQQAECLTYLQKSFIKKNKKQNQSIYAMTANMA